MYLQPTITYTQACTFIASVPENVSIPFNIQSIPVAYIIYIEKGTVETTLKGILVIKFIYKCTNRLLQ